MKRDPDITPDELHSDLIMRGAYRLYTVSMKGIVDNVSVDNCSMFTDRSLPTESRLVLDKAKVALEILKRKGLVRVADVEGGYALWPFIPSNGLLWFHENLLDE